MAKDVYCDQTGGSDANAGTNWGDAFLTLAKALDGTEVVASDTLWVKNNGTAGTGVTFFGVTTYTNDPPQVIGVKSATSATPPANSDLIPGFRTGQSTPAYDDAGVPTFTTTTVNDSINFKGYFRFYGMKMIAYRSLNSSSAESSILFEECHLTAGNGQTTGNFNFGFAQFPHTLQFKNCKLVTLNSGKLITNNVGGHIFYKKCIFDISADPMVRFASSILIFDSCDFSAQSGALVDNAGGQSPGTQLHFLNCKIHASSALVSGSIAEKFRTEFHLTSSATGKTTGQTFQELDIITDNGNIVEETTRFRTGGADDGGTGEWSLAFTPNVNGTRDNREGMIGPRMAVEVVGDGTAQTLTVYIANSSASTDYQDDEVWLVAKSPNESGTADYDFYTTQMDLQATSANITDDGSTWGSGANNSQKLQITLSPDYDGIIECWVVFAKNFGASPETLYVDPLPVLS